MYHVYEYLAKDALRWLCEEKPDERRDALKISSHYAGDSVAAKNYAGMHVALCILLADSVAGAERLLATRLGPKAGPVIRLLSTCINDPFFAALKNETYLYRKGWLRDQDTYYPASKALSYGSEFHQSCARIDPAYQPVLLAAIRASHRRTGTAGPVLSKRCLPFVAAQLMQIGPERAFRLTALAHKTSANDFTAFLNQSRRFVTAMADRMQLLLHPDQLCGDHANRLKKKPRRTATRYFPASTGISTGISISRAPSVQSRAQRTGRAG